MKVNSGERESQSQAEMESIREYVRDLEERIRQKDAIIRLIVRGAAAVEEEARKLSDDVPF